MNYAVKVKAFIQIFPVKIVRQDFKKKRERERKKIWFLTNALTSHLNVLYVIQV